MNTMKTTIRARILRLSLISVGIAFVCYITLAVYAVRYLSVDIQETLLGKDVEIVNNAIETIYIDMEDLAAEVCDHNDLLEAYYEGDVSEVITDYLNDSWIQGVRVVDDRGVTIYQYGIECDITKTMYGKDGKLILITSAALGSGRLYLASYPGEIGLFAKIIDDKMIEFVVEEGGREIYNTLGADNIAPKFKYNGRNYISEKIVQGDITISAIEDVTHMNRVLIQVVLVFCVLAAILAPVAIYVSRRVAGAIAGSIQNIVNRLYLLAEGDITTAVVKSHRGDETEVLENALEKTVTQIRVYMDDIKKYAEAIHAGNVGVKSNVEYSGDFRGLYTSMKAIQGDLEHIVRETREAVDCVYDASKQIMNSNQTLADGSTEQAASTEQMSSTMHEISDTVIRNDEDCIAARKASDEAVKAVDEVSENSKRLNASMRNIESMMGEIQKIFNALEDIAFNTNILAINASIEAAHAGMAGRGFAVVADEVAALADKSRQSVEESTQLLEQLTTVIDDGRKITVKTSDSVVDVERAIQALNKNIAKVAEATSRQTTMLGQITSGIDNIANVTQTNSATSEENLSISESLVSKVETVENMLKKYDLSEIRTTEYKSAADTYEDRGSSGGYEEPEFYYASDDSSDGSFDMSLDVSDNNDDDDLYSGLMDDGDGLIEVVYPENYVPDTPDGSDE
ncbi:MAG: hypothetical protein J1F11_06160 [Oscillospiraceae bacterium]|nr:hypothetical protein [Oscillospiraceae bacterium]